MAEEVIGLLFGVDGGGEIDGKSGDQIVKDLTKIVNQINGGKSKVPKIKLKFDVSEAKKAVSDLKRQLKDIEKIASIKVTQNGGKAGQGGTTQNLQKQIEKYQRLSATIKQWVQTSKQGAKLSEEYSTITRESDGTLSGTAEGYEQTVVAINEVNKAMKELRLTFDAEGKPIKPDKKQFAEIAAQIGITEEQYQKLFKQAETGSATVGVNVENAHRKNRQSWTATASKIRDEVQRMYGTIAKDPNAKRLADDIIKYSQSATGNVGELKNKYDQLRNSIHESGADIETWGDKFKKTFAGKVRSALAGAITAAFTKYLREIYQNVVNIDKALVNLQIASGKSREETQRLVKEYAQLGKQLGATTTEVAEAADTWLRQGYSAEEANTLIKNSMMLSKLGQMESTEASTALTSAMKGYGVAVEDSIKIVDKFTKVDMEAAASAGDIATAMAETATSADVAGVSMDRLIGYLAVVKEVTQDGAESVGTFYKTLFARMNNVKAGKFVDDETGEALNDVEKILGELGIALRDSNGLFRDSGEVLDEVAARWNAFDNVAQHAIATAFAGTRQQEKFIVLMENYETALKYSETATNSAGTAMEKYGDYIEGIGAKMNALKAAFEKLSVAVLDSGLITGTVQFITWVLEAATWIMDKIGGLNTILYVTLSILATIKADNIFNFITGIVPKIISLITALTSKILIFSQGLAAAKVSGMSMGEGVAAAFNSIGISASAAQVAVGAFMAILGIAIIAINKYNSNIQESVNKSLSMASAANSEGKEYLETTKSLNQLIDEYEELSKLNNGVFKGESAEKVRTIQDEITKLVGDQAKNIDLVNGKLDEEIRKMRELASANADDAMKKGQVQVANARNSYETKVESLTAPKHAIEGTGETTALWGLLKTGEGQRDFVEEWTKNYGVKWEEYDSIAPSGGEHTYYGLKNNFDSFEDFIAQYENILRLNSNLASDHGDSGLFKATSDYIKEYKDIYDNYISGNLLIEEAEKTKAGIDEIFTEPKNTGLAVALKSTSDILEEVQGGYDGISEALSSVTSEGYLTADALSTLFKLEEENALAGLKLEDILTRDAKGYKLADNALTQYTQSLIKQYAAIEKIKTSQDALNSVKNLESLLSLLTTLSYESKKDTSANEAEERLNKQKEALNDQIDAYKELIDLRKDLLKSYIDELKYEEELAEKQDDVSRLRAKLTVAKLDDSAAGKSRVRELEEELKKAEKDLKEFTLEHAVDEMTQTLEDQYNEYKYFIGKRIDEIAEEISKLSDSSSGSSADFSWLKTAIEEIETTIKQIKTEFSTWNKFSEFNIVIESTKVTNPGIPTDPEIFKGKGTWIAQYHTGGIVGGAHLDSNEEFAKLLKGEFVSTPSQMKRFMEDTLPRIANYTNSKESNEFNAPLVEINCDNVTTESLPELERVVDEAVKEIKKQLDSGMSRLGHKLAPTKRLI